MMHDNEHGQTPSPQRGEGWGEGDTEFQLNRRNPLTSSPLRGEGNSPGTVRYLYEERCEATRLEGRLHLGMCCILRDAQCTLPDHLPFNCVSKTGRPPVR